MRIGTLLLLGVLAVGCRTTLPPGDGGAGGSGSAGDDMAAGGVCKALCTFGLTCCQGGCVNLQNDIHNCGGCGVVCTGVDPFCDGTRCAPSPCKPGCTGGQICCLVNGPGPPPPPTCTAPSDAGTCPIGCPLCE